MTRKRSMFLMAAGLAASCGTTDKTSTSSTPSEPKVATWAPAVKIDPDTLEKQQCGNPGDPDCDWQGPGQLLKCNQSERVCEYLRSDDDCTYADIAGDPMSCPFDACSNDNDCGLANPDPAQLTATCIYTEASIASESLGVCFFAYAQCTALEGTPCEEQGVTVCVDENCSCTAEGDPSMAWKKEFCDEVDNDCDGETDEGLDLGAACDGNDSDSCANGTLTCAADEETTECVNESPEDIVELCNGQDDDCDGQMDEDFLELGKACDGDDSDLCEDGFLICDQTGDGTTLRCDDFGPSTIESCNGQDDDCDGAVDEGCDDDADGWCDEAMTVMAGATCTSGDCDDEDAAINPDAVEFCDEVDNDCDDLEDEDFNLGTPCFDGEGVCMVEGTFSECSEDGMSAVCSVVADESDKLDQEVCNGLDDTCDGPVDEGCDDDGDGWCDAEMVTGEGAACEGDDCDDLDPAVNSDATEICDGIDNDCDSLIDEGCDDDGDGWCDEAMGFSAGAACQSGDCADDDEDVNPGQEEQCLTAFDDNCDGDTEHLADGATPACSSCANAIAIPCNTDVVINTGKEPNADNAIDTYTCQTALGPKALKGPLSAKEAVLISDADPGTTVSFQFVAKPSDTLIYAVRLHGSCEPDAGTSSVTAYDPDEGLDGTCAARSQLSLSGIVVGEDFVGVDSAEDVEVTVRFTCD